MKIGVVVPHNFYAPWDFVVSAWGVAVNYDFIYETGADVALNRDRLVEKANDDLLIVDSDSVFTISDVHKIEDHLKTKDVITGVCPLGHPPYMPSIYKLVNGEFEFYKPEKLEKIDGCGGAFLGISKRIFTKLPPHPFERIRGLGNDLSFCWKLKELNIDIWCAPEIRIGHVKPTMIRI